MYYCSWAVVNRTEVYAFVQFKLADSCALRRRHGRVHGAIMVPAAAAQAAVVG